jgi:surface protein
MTSTNNVTPKLALHCCLYHHSIPSELVVIVQRYLYLPLDNQSIRRNISYWCDSVSELSGRKSSLRQTWIQYGHISDWDTPQVTDMSELFKCKHLFNENINKWNTENALDMSHMFYGACRFNQPLESWNVQKVKTIRCMFCYASDFNQPLESWDVSNVSDMSAMFRCASNFNQPLEAWNIASVANMSGMFKSASKFSQCLEKWIAVNPAFDLNKLGIELSIESVERRAANKHQVNGCLIM